MGSPKLTGLLISLVIVSFLAGSFGIWFSQMSSEYDTNYDNESFETYNKMQNIKNSTEEIQAKTQGINKTSTIDILGDMFSNAYNVLKLSGQSLNLFSTMANDAASEENIGLSADLARTTGILIITILFVIGIVVAVLVRRDIL